MTCEVLMQVFVIHVSASYGYNGAILGSEMLHSFINP